jgi:hypothetical protein
MTGLAANCSVSDNPRTVSVTAGEVAETTFAVVCAANVGDLTVTTSTTGGDLDPDGYTVEVGGTISEAIDLDETITITDVAAGDHSVELTGVANNCSVVGDNPRTVTVPNNAAVQTDFEVECVALTGTLTVTASTTGDGLDPDGYTVSVDGGPEEDLATNGDVDFNDVATGDRSVLLSGIATNCSVTGDNPATVTVPSVGPANHTFDVECTDIVGSVEVTTSTTGAELDPDGYTLNVEGESGVAIGLNETLTVDDVSAGERTVELAGVASNCSVAGENPRTVTVTDGGTVSTTFDVTCLTQLDNQIVFDTDRDGNTEIYVMNPDGSGVMRLTTNVARDAEPYVSPNGTKIAFVSDRDGDNEIWVMDADGGNPVQLTFDGGSDKEPAWSPDDTKIAFSRRPTGGDRHVWVMDADGSNQTQMTFTGGSNALPAWSPDGSTIVFNSDRDGDAEIFVMNSDGSGNPTQLTSNTAPDFAAAFSPDGSQIAFTSERDGNREIYVMTTSGTAQTNLSNDAAPDLAPQWSPDGSQIAFASARDGNNEVYVMTSGGTGQTNISNNVADDFEVSWSR